MEAARQKSRVENPRLRAIVGAPAGDSTDIQQQAPQLRQVPPSEVPQPDPEEAERRLAARREVAPDRAFAPFVAVNGELRGWPYLALAMAVSILLAAGLTGRFPGMAVTIELALALAMTTLVSRLHILVANVGGAGGLVATFTLPLVPQLLFGLGIGGWFATGGLALETSVIILIMVGVMATLYLRRHPGLALAAPWTMALGAVLANLWIGGLMGLLGAAVLFALAGREQVLVQLREDRQRSAQDRAQNRARDILSDYEDTGQGWFWETDRRSQLTYVSDTVARVLGTNAEVLMTKPLVTLFDLADASDTSERTLMFHLSTRSAFKELAVRAATGGNERWWSISGRPIYDGFNNFIGFRGSGTDLTERRRSQEEVSRLANFDSLTGLANRFQITRVLEKILTSQQEANRACTIFLLDLDRFKHVNDTLGHVRVAVNVSPLQFSSPQLPAVVAQAIAAAGIRPDQLELEITESVFLSDDESTDAMFRALKRIGVRLALDDFGTGYSSLGYLKSAPFDKIKIDQSFVRGATEPGSRNGAIIASITSLAHALGMETTVEGVETLDELELVRRHGCSHVQGYIYDRPLNREATHARLAAGLQAVAKGPRSARAPRQTMLRKVVLDHQGNLYEGTIRNISTSGALIEGLWSVPVGTEFKLQISANYFVTCTTRWSMDERMGVEFANPLQRNAAGQITAVQGPSPKMAAAKPTVGKPVPKPG